MPQSLANVLIHLVFSTKDHRTALHTNDAAPLYAYMAGLFNSLGSPALQIGGASDHIHALCSLGRSQTISDLVKQVKTQSSKWLKDRAPIHHSFAWQAGYGVFSVSQSQKDSVCDYILNQADHHKKASFQDEFRVLLKRHNLAYDERYVWA
jgi:REP-associated tyrosine transposase